MFDTLSDIQREIVFNKEGLFVVRACPGSGKTYSVASRLAKKIMGWEKSNQGIAAISFTNVAWKEIQEMLFENFRIKTPLGYPHFLGTIDSFINTHIFLPHGHLLMGCPNRPVLVGDPHGTWNVKRYDKDYDQYFGIVSFDADDNLLYPHIQKTFFFPYSQIYKNDGTESRHAENLRESKLKYWKKGYANQQDANYFALRLLQRYPQVAKALANRFTEFILDEAQDTSEIQMKIIDILCQNGLQNVLLVGDPDQAIFEWNNASPGLFKTKYEEWSANSIVLNDNRRSSQLICNVTFKLSSLTEVSKAVCEDVKSLTVNPEIVEYSADNIQEVVQFFLQKCAHLGIEITPKKVAVLCRSKSFIQTLAGVEAENQIYPWIEGDFLTSELIFSKFLFQKSYTKEAFRSGEKIIYQATQQKKAYIRAEIDKYINQTGFLEIRSKVYELLKMLPDIENSLGVWVTQANNILKTFTPLFALQFNPDAKDLSVKSCFTFTEERLSELNYRIGTVHSVKGETFEAILLFLKKKGLGRNYISLIDEEVSIEDDEELRIVYVGITRPRMLLMIAAPDEANKTSWEEKLLK